jgi:hypothetical protein
MGYMKHCNGAGTIESVLGEVVLQRDSHDMTNKIEDEDKKHDTIHWMPQL